MSPDDRPGPVVRKLPDHIGRYRVTGRVGRGAMGVVYSADDEMMGREVAIKVLMADLEGDPTTRTRFYREAQAAGRLLHRNIITVFDIGEEDGRAFIVMELLKGHTLDEFLRRGGVTIEQKVDLMTQVCEGLQVAHAQGIYHRDIKPGNLFVQTDLTLKVLDFSVARLASSTLTGAGAVIGTPDYMAPEQARGQEVDARSDVFSSASVFYFMLSGQKPFSGRTLPETLRRVQFDDPPPLAPDTAPPALTSIILRGLAKDPRDRYQSANEMLADLVRFRRQYEAETRAIAARVHGRVNEVAALRAEWRQLAEWLELDSADDRASALEELRAEYPAFVEQSGQGMLQVPFGRAEADRFDRELEAERERIARDTVAWKPAKAALAAAESLVEQGKSGDALASLEQVRRAVPAGGRLRRLEARCGVDQLPTVIDSPRIGRLSDAAIDECSDATLVWSKPPVLKPAPAPVIREAYEIKPDLISPRAPEIKPGLISSGPFDSRPPGTALAPDESVDSDKTIVTAPPMIRARAKGPTPSAPGAAGARVEEAALNDRRGTLMNRIKALLGQEGILGRLRSRLWRR